MTAANNPTRRPTKNIRRQAEQRVLKTTTDVSGMSAEEIGGLLYELEVHQEELKIQNEELRRSQLELESSHEHLADLYDFAPVGYLTVDANGLIINANLATATTLGQERSKIVRTRLALYCDQGSRVELRDHIEKVLSSEMSQSCELKFTTPDGATLDARLHSNHLVASGTGDDRQCRMIMTDMTRHKMIEMDLRDSESFFRTIFEQAAVGVAQINSVSGTILKVNRRYCEMLGTPAEGLVGRTWMELTHPDDLAADLGNMKRLRAGDIGEFSVEKRMERQDGSILWINLSVSPMWQPGEEPSTHIAIMQDVTERKQSIDSLQLSEERYRSLVSASAATVWTADPQGGFSYPQPMWEAYTGQPWQDHQHGGWRKMLHPDDAERMTGDWQMAVDHPEAFFTAGRIFHAASGLYRYCEVRATPLRNPDGSVREWIGTTADVHDHRLAEFALATRNKMTEAIRKIQAEFVAGEAPHVTFDKLLAVLLNITAGDYGFIGEVSQDDAGVPFLTTHAITNIAWDDATRKFYDEQAPAGLEFRNLENLFGSVITSGRAVITDDPANDPRRGGLPPGHPALNSFMGLPIYAHGGLIGMVGVANCTGGITKELVDLLDPFLATCGNLIEASRNERNRLKTEESLRESKERFRQLAENINEVFWLQDVTAHKVLYVSPPYEKNWGRSIEALYADPLEWAQAVHPEDRERVEKSFLEHGETEWEMEYRILRPDATERYIRDRAFPVRDESGTVVRLAGISEDVTDRKNVELALRESEEKFRALTEKSPAIVLIARLDQILYCNSMLSEITGYSHEELLRMPLRDIIHPDFRESIADRQRRRLKGEEVPRRYDGKIVTRSGEERWLDTSVQLIEFEGLPAALVTCVNVTERKLTEAALRQSEERLREVNASLEQRVAERTAELTETNRELVAFAHTVSHDLRSPLRAMEGFSTALAEDYGERLDEEGREFIQHIIDSAQRMDALINDLLAFSRLGRRELRLKSIRLKSIVTEALRQLSSEIDACDTKLDVADQMPTVLGHKATLVQVVANLLSNAIKFVAEGVKPEIRAWAERRDDGMIRLWIEDNGIGIDDTYHDRIFHVFERLHGIESYPGTGIGLAIVARACERLGGRYGFESQRDQGSRFWVEFQEGDENP